jgi:hypothetical protein
MSPHSIRSYRDIRIGVSTTRCQHHSVSAPLGVSTNWCQHQLLSAQIGVSTTRYQRKLMSAPFGVSTNWCQHHSVSARIVAAKVRVSTPIARRLMASGERSDAVISLRGGRRAPARTTLARGWDEVVPPSQWAPLGLSAPLSYPPVFSPPGAWPRLDF